MHAWSDPQRTIEPFGDALVFRTMHWRCADWVEVEDPELTKPIPMSTLMSRWLFRQDPAVRVSLGMRTGEAVPGTLFLGVGAVGVTQAIADELARRAATDIGEALDAFCLFTDEIQHILPTEPSTGELQARFGEPRCHVPATLHSGFVHAMELLRHSPGELGLRIDLRMDAVSADLVAGVESARRRLMRHSQRPEPTDILRLLSPDAGQLHHLEAKLEALAQTVRTATARVHLLGYRPGSTLLDGALGLLGQDLGYTLETVDGPARPLELDTVALHRLCATLDWGFACKHFTSQRPGASRGSEAPTLPANW